MKKVNKLASVMIGNWVCDACLTNAKRKILLGNGSTFFHQGPDLPHLASSLRQLLWIQKLTWRSK